MQDTELITTEREAGEENWKWRKAETEGVSSRDHLLNKEQWFLFFIGDQTLVTGVALVSCSFLIL